MRSPLFLVGLILALALPGAARETSAPSLQQAVLAKDFAAAQAALAAGADIEDRDRYGNTPLLMAIQEKSVALAGLLLAKGADPNAAALSSYDRQTPLEAAARAGSRQIFDALLDHGAEPESGSARLLGAAAQGGDAGLVRLALSKGAAVDASSGYGETALMSAARSGSLEAVKALVEKGADVNAESRSGRTPLGSAASGGSAEVLSYLLSKGADTPAASDAPLLVAAAGSGSTEAVELLLSRGADKDLADAVARRDFCAAAAGSGLVGMVRLALDKGCEPAEDSSSGRTMLGAAAASGSLDAVRLLLARGADADAGDRSLETPLMYGAGYPALAAELLAKGADPKAQDERERTPLSYAAEAGSTETIRLLLAKGAEPDAADLTGKTPLMYAAGAGHAEAVKLLLSKDADPRLKDFYGRTAASHAAESGDAESFRLLFAKTRDANETDSYGQPILQYALTGRQLPIVTQLLDEGADVEAVYRLYGKKAIGAAAERGFSAAIPALLAKGASIESPDEHAQTPLLMAAGAGALETMKRLAAKGADVNALDDDRQNALMHAARAGSVPALRWLLARGLELNAADKEGRTALWHALDAGQPEAARFLLAKGALIHRPGLQPRDLASAALRSGDAALIRSLAAKGLSFDVRDAYGKPAAVLAAEAHSLDALRALAALKVPLGEAASDGRTALHAAARGPVSVARWLLAHGASATAVDRSGRTPLFDAAAGGDPAVIAALLEAGAQADARDKEGMTPLMAAAPYSRAGFYALLAKGADPLAVDNAGHTVLYYAAYSGDLMRVRELLDRGAEPTARDKAGHSVVSNTRTSGTFTVVRYLLERGAAPGDSTDDEQPLTDAAGWRSAARVKLLLDKGAAIEGSAYGKPLASAAARGRLDVVKLLLAKGADINAKSRFGDTALSAAAGEGRADVVRLLLDKGASTSGAIGGKALWVAASNGHLDCVELLAKRVPIDAVNEYGTTALIGAAGSGRVEVVRYLLKKGADIKHAEKYGATALHAAASSGHDDMVSLLLEKGAPIEARDSNGHTPLWSAVSLGHLATAKLLLSKGAALNVRDNDGATLVDGVRCDAAAIDFLAERGLSVNLPNSKDETPLMHSVWCADNSGMKALLAHGADVDDQDASKDTALIKLAWNSPSAQQLEAADTLLAHNASLSYADKNGDTPLLVAARQGNAALVRRFLSGVPNDRAKDGTTAVMYAAQNGSTDTLKVLADAGADLSALNNDGKNALSLALGYNPHLPAAQWLLAHGVSVDVVDKRGYTPLTDALSAWSPEKAVVAWLLENADPTVGSADHTPIGEALAKGNLGWAKKLIERGADVKAAGPLVGQFIENGKPDAAKFLLEHGADPNAVYSSWSPLMWAASQGDVESARLLLAKGADPRFDYNGTSALSIAQNSSKYAFVSLLNEALAKTAPRVKASPAAEPEAVAAAPAADGVSKAELQNIVKEAVDGAIAAQRPAEPAKPAAPVYHSDVDKPRFKLAQNPDDVAVVVGIEKYSADIPDAQFAERDAAAVRAHLVALGFAPRNIRYLAGSKATRAGMEAQIEGWLPRVTRDDSRVFFYFSGHGAPDPTSGKAYILPWDGDADSLQTSGYPVERLYQKLAKLPARQIVVALDSCFSGARGRSVLPRGARPLVTVVKPDAISSDRLVSLAASGGTQISGTLEDQGHGLFTYYLLKGLEGAAARDGVITVGSLYNYVKPRVEDAASQQNREQTPQVVPGLLGDRSKIVLRKL